MRSRLIAGLFRGKTSLKPLEQTMMKTLLADLLVCLIEIRVHVLRILPEMSVDRILTKKWQINRNNEVSTLETISIFGSELRSKDLGFGDRTRASTISLGEEDRMFCWRFLLPFVAEQNHGDLATANLGRKEGRASAREQCSCPGTIPFTAAEYIASEYSII